MNGMGGGDRRRVRPGGLACAGMAGLCDGHVWGLPALLSLVRHGYLLCYPLLVCGFDSPRSLPASRA
jgi:hypothetical protein